MMYMNPMIRASELRFRNINIRELQAGYIVKYLQIDDENDVRMLRDGIVQKIYGNDKILVRTLSGEPFKVNPNKGNLIEEIHIDWVYDHESPSVAEYHRLKRKARTIGASVVCTPVENKSSMRGILRRVVEETSTSWIRFVYGEIGSGYEIESFDMPISSSLVLAYDEWSDDEVAVLNEEINNLVFQKNNPIRYQTHFTGRLEEGDGVFLLLCNQTKVRMFPMTVDQVTRTQATVGGIKFRRQSTNDHCIGSMLSTPKPHSPEFQSRTEMRLESHTYWALDRYKRTVSDENYAAYITQINELNQKT